MIITVSKKSLIIGTLAILVIGIFAVGLAVTPFDETGAVLLSTGNRQIKAYLDDARGWQQALDETREQLLSLLPADTTAAELWKPAPAGGAPASIYEQNRVATTVMDRLTGVNIQVDRATVPHALQGTHAVVHRAVQDHLQLAHLILDYVGAPDETKTPGIEAQAEVCQQDTSRLQELLEEGK